MRTVCCLLGCLTLAAPAEEGRVITQNLGKDAAIELGAEAAGVGRIVQSQRTDRNLDAAMATGVHVRGGEEVVVGAAIVPGNYHGGGLIGVHGEGTHVRYRGHWRGDEGGSYPMLALTDGGRMTWEAEAHVDFVMDPNFFTRQLWVVGDGSGTLELAPGFVADRTEGATVADAMGTIRLGGATLITHHSRSLPYNARPDGRGGIYDNGHVVFEGEAPSRWIVASDPHVYAAQIDFATDGTIECRAHLTHSGEKRDCLAVGNGGPFVSTGAFRTTAEDVTITKAGPAMLSLDGQQGYRRGAALVIEEGLVRMHTDPGEGDHYDRESGPHLHVTVREGGSLYLGAPLMRIASLMLEDGATCWLLEGSELRLGELAVADGAEFVHDGTLTRE